VSSTPSPLPQRKGWEREGEKRKKEKEDRKRGEEIISRKTLASL
jgi:hypothetical protein